MISLKDITNNDLLLSWLLILGFSLASVLGASLVFVDLLFGTGVETTKSWLKYAWPLSGGILLYSTQLSLVPHAYEKLASVPYFSDYPLIYFGAFYSMGIMCTHFMSALVNLIAPSAIDTCESHSHAHAHDQTHSHSHSHEDLHSHAHSHSRSDLELGTHNNSEQNSFDNTRVECSQINLAQPVQYGTITNYSSKSSEYENSNSSTSKSHSCTCNKSALDQICKNIPYPDYRRMSIISSKSEHEILLKIQPPVHKHDENKEELGWKVSIQTAVAIACHKFPEGLLMIIGNSVNQKLGWSLFLGLFVHNFPEGFTLAIPMLMSTGSRMKAFLFAAAIGGLTQPIGGLVGTIMVDSINPESFKFFNAIILSTVGGMMLTVVLQCIRSISQSYFEKEAKLKYLLISFFAGLLSMVVLNFVSNLIF